MQRHRGKYEWRQKIEVRRVQATAFNEVSGQEKAGQDKQFKTG